MGLCISHGCYRGSYSQFGFFRESLCAAAGLPPLGFMEGFFSETDKAAVLKITVNSLLHRGVVILHPDVQSAINQLPIKWACLKPDVLFKLLNHSDSEGFISWKIADKLAERLKELKPHMTCEEIMDNFIVGLKTAHNEKANIEFY